MTIECYHWPCKHHSHHFGKEEGPFCFEQKCLWKPNDDELRLLEIIAILEHELSHLHAVNSNCQKEQRRLYKTHSVPTWRAKKDILTGPVDKTDPIAKEHGLQTLKMGEPVLITPSFFDLLRKKLSRTPMHPVQYQGLSVSIDKLEEVICKPSQEPST